jgi:hypothetical protein
VLPIAAKQTLNDDVMPLVRRPMYMMAILPDDACSSLASGMVFVAVGSGV